MIEADNTAPTTPAAAQLAAVVARLRTDFRTADLIATLDSLASHPMAGAVARQFGVNLPPSMDVAQLGEEEAASGLEMLGAVADSYNAVIGVVEAA